MEMNGLGRKKPASQDGFKGLSEASRAELLDKLSSRLNSSSTGKIRISKDEFKSIQSIIGG